MECEAFTVTFVDYLLVYENKYYLQVYLDNCADKNVYMGMIEYLDDNSFETDELINVVIMIELISRFCM